MQKKRIWRLPTIELEQQLSVAQEMGVARPLAQVLLNRGLSSPEQVREFIEAGIENLRDPLDIPGMLIGAERIIKALDQNEHILIYGDYDVDGITATTLLTSFLRGLGGQVSYYIPDRRDEGYGLNVQALEQAQAKGAKLVVTVDCGISAKEEAQAAVQLGLDLVITDHHQVPQELPEAIAVIDPKIVAEEQPWTDLAGVGVAYKLAQAVKKLLGEDYYLEEYLDLVALGTVADIVPLRKENRILVKAGLAQISQTKRPGLQALLNVSGIGQEQVTVGQIGYAVAPRLNACGRLSQAEIGVELLLTEDEKRAQEIAQLLDQENRSRQDLESAIYTEALALVEKDVDISQDKVIILAAKDWHPGVIGIVASRLVEKFYRPTILISLEEGVGKGSGRSIHGFDLYQALQNVQEYLLSFGGHKMAAGLSIAEDQLPAFKSALKAYTEEVLTEKDLVPFIEVDCEILPEEINAELLEGIDKLAPFGFHNPAPVFALRNRSITNCSQVGKNNKHLRLRVQKEENSWLDGIAFQAGSLKEEACTWERCDLAFSPEINNWQGRSQIQLVIKDLKSATQPDDPTKPLSFLDELYQEGEIWLEDDYYRDIGEKEEFFTKLVGVTFENRQQLLREIPDGDSLEIIREYDNIHDKYAIKVCWQKQHIGYLNVKLARRLAPLMDKGVKYEAYLTLVTGRDKSTLGANICIQRKEEKLSPTDYNLRRQQLEQLDRSELRETIRQAILGKYDYHEKQLEAINALEAGQSSLVILATGRGKSAIFQTAAAELAITKKMMTLIVYPLRSLVNDQYRQLQSKLEPLGIDVQAVNGSMSVSEKKEFMKRLLQGQGDIILTTPEFLEFHLDKFKTIAPKIGLFVVDESHHLAQAKRRGYRSLAKSWRQLGKPLALATTATANNDTAKAIIQSLECQKIIVEEYIRTNLKLLDRRDEKDKLAYLLKLIARDEKTVIYVNSRKQAYQLAGELRSYYPQGKDQIAFYHGGLSSEQRLTLEDMYRQGELKVMVTTSAFGEGINIDDIKHVVLYHLCFSATEFNQLSGRAGRNRQEAFVHLLFGRRDRQLNEFILASVTPPREVMGIVYIFLRDQAAKNNPLNLTNAEITEAMQKKGLKNFREQTASTCLAIFEELGLLLREVTGNKRYIHFCPPPPGKMNLTDSIRYQEGLNEEEEFREFADNILVAGEEEIMAAFNKPIIPQGKVL